MNNYSKLKVGMPRFLPLVLCIIIDFLLGYMENVRLII